MFHQRMAATAAALFVHVSFIQSRRMRVLSFTVPSSHSHLTGRQGQGARRTCTSNISTRKISLSRQGRIEDEDANADDVLPAALNDGEESAASIPNLTISLVKSIVGSGVLALPAGVATLLGPGGGGGELHSHSPPVIPTSTTTVLVQALVIMVVVGMINAYMFSLIGRVCAMTGATSYRQAWELTVGRKEEEKNSCVDGAAVNTTATTSSSSELVAIMVTLKTALSCLAFSIIIADSFQSLAIAAGFDDITRNQVLVIVSIFALLPLCLLRDLRSLAAFSLLGILGMLFTTCAMVLRYLDGSYGVHSTGVYLLSQQDPANLVQSSSSLGDSSGPSSASGIIVLACTLATAFVAHYNAPRFYSELKDNSVMRFNTVVVSAYAISTVIFYIVATTGFLTFGSASSGYILNNYSPYDPLMTTSRAAVALSIVFTYPLPFVGFRDGVLDVMQLKDDHRTEEETTTTVNFVISVVLLMTITIVAANVTDLALVLTVGGGTFSTAVASIFPPLMFRAAVKNDSSQNPNNKVDATLSLVFMWISIAIGFTGVSIALENAYH